MRQYTKEQLSTKKTEMVTAALARAEKIGFGSLTRDEVANACNCSPALVNIRFGTLAAMKNDILRAAIKRERLPIVAYALAVAHPLCKKISPELRAKASAHLSGK